MGEADEELSCRIDPPFIRVSQTKVRILGNVGGKRPACVMAAT
jgi:hypothetical protein